MCGCKGRIEAELIKELRAGHPDATDHQVWLTSYIPKYDEERKVSEEVPYMTADFRTLRVGEGKVGRGRWKTDKMLVSINFCPFCGENLHMKSGS